MALHVLESEDCDAECSLSLALVEDLEMSRLNQRYRDVEGPTDVLAFPLADDIDPLYLGEVVISPAQASLNAREDGADPEDELLFLVVHGVLHLLGYDHHAAKERQAMERRQRELLESYSGGGRGH